MLAPLSDDDRKKLGHFGRKVLSRMVLSAAGALGLKFGEAIADALFGSGENPDEGGDDDEDGDK